MIWSLGWILGWLVMDQPESVDVRTPQPLSHYFRVLPLLHVLFAVRIEPKFPVSGVRVLLNATVCTACEFRLMPSDLDILESLLHALRSTRSVIATARQAVLEVSRVLQAPHAELLMVVGDGEALESIVALGVYEAVASERIARGEGIAWAALETRQVMLTADAYDPRLAHDDHAVYEQLVAPMFDAFGQTFAVLVLARHHTEAFEDSDQTLLRTMAPSIGMALERSHAIEQAKHQSRESHGLIALAQLLQGQREGVLESALETIRDMQGAHLVALGVLEPGLFSVQAHAGPLSPALYEALHRLEIVERRAAEDALTERLPLEVADARNHPAFANLTEVNLSRASLMTLRAEHPRLALALLWLEAGDTEDGMLELDAAETPQPEPQPTLEAAAQMLHALVNQLEGEARFSATYEGALRTIGLALESRDREAPGHTDRVADLAERVGRELGLGDRELRDLRWGAYLHDIGKLEVPDWILLKADRLSEGERQTVRAHAVLGERLTFNLPYLPETVRAVVRHHHERYNGYGYPDRLSGANIPLVARVFAVCDVFDALISNRPYKAGMTLSDALAEIRGGLQSGQFDPMVVGALEIVLRDGWTPPNWTAPERVA